MICEPFLRKGSRLEIEKSDFSLHNWLILNFQFKYYKNGTASLDIDLKRWQWTDILINSNIIGMKDEDGGYTTLGDEGSLIAISATPRPQMND